MIYLLMLLPLLGIVALGLLLGVFTLSLILYVKEDVLGAKREFSQGAGMRSGAQH